MPSRTKVLNVVLAGHVDHGKSSLIAAITGKFPDKYAFEIEKGMTVHLKVVSFYYKNVQINFIDTPGHVDFRHNVNLALVAADLLVLVVSSARGFQARTHYILNQALDYKLPILVTATKMDLSNSFDLVLDDLKKYGLEGIPVIPTSAKEKTGIDALLDAIISVRPIRRYSSKPKIIVIGHKDKAGIGTLYLCKIKLGTITRGQKINSLNIKGIYTIRDAPTNVAKSGDLVYIFFDGKPNLKLGVQIEENKIKTLEHVKRGIFPSLEFTIAPRNPVDSPKLESLLLELKDSIGIDYVVLDDTIRVSVLGELQFHYLLKALESSNIPINVINKQKSGIVTVGMRSRKKFGTADIEVIPKSSRGIVIHRIRSLPEAVDALAVNTVADALGITGLTVIVYSGDNEDDIVTALTKIIQNTELMTLYPNESILIRTNNTEAVARVTDEVGGTIALYSEKKLFVLIPAFSLDTFVQKVMQRTHGNAEIRLIRTMPGERILGIDPGLRHIGFAYIRGDNPPEIWHINLPVSLSEKRSQESMLAVIKKELALFLEYKEIPTKIFIGGGTGARYILNVVQEVFDINHVDIFLVDERMSSREALYKLRSKKLEKVRTTSLVDHAIAALIIARRGIFGKRIKVKNIEEKIYRHIASHANLSNAFKKLYKVKSAKDLQPGTYLKIRDPSYFATHIEQGDIIIFWKWRQGKAMVVSSLTGSRFILRFKDDVRIEKDFFNVFAPLKPKNT